MSHFWPPAICCTRRPKTIFSQNGGSLVSHTSPVKELIWDSSQLMLHLPKADEWLEDEFEWGNEMADIRKAHRKLFNGRGLNLNVLEFFLLRPHYIPTMLQTKRILFPGTLFHDGNFYTYSLGLDFTMCLPRWDIFWFNDRSWESHVKEFPTSPTYVALLKG